MPEVNKYDPAAHFELLKQIFNQQQEISERLERIEKRESTYQIDPAKWYTAAEAAEFLGIKPSTLRIKCSKENYIEFRQTAPNAPKFFKGQDIQDKLDEKHFSNNAEVREMERIKEKNKLKLVGGKK